MYIYIHTFVSQQFQCRNSLFHKNMPFKTIKELLNVDLKKWTALPWTKKISLKKKKNIFLGRPYTWSLSSAPMGFSSLEIPRNLRIPWMLTIMQRRVKGTVLGEKSPNGNHDEDPSKKTAGGVLGG